MTDRWIAGCLLCLLPALGAVGADFHLDLQDQYGDPFRYPLQTEAGSASPVTLLVTADRKGADDRRAWAEAIRDRYGEALDASPPELVVLPVAHLAGVPKLFRGMIVDRFLDGDKPTGLDWQGQVEAQLGLEEGTPNLAVFDAEGKLVAQATGPPDEETRSRIFATLDDLLARRGAVGQGPPYGVSPLRRLGL